MSRSRTKVGFNLGVDATWSLTILVYIASILGYTPVKPREGSSEPLRVIDFALLCDVCQYTNLTHNAGHIVVIMVGSEFPAAPFVYARTTNRKLFPSLVEPHVSSAEDPLDRTTVAHPCGGTDDLQLEIGNTREEVCCLSEPK